VNLPEQIMKKLNLFANAAALDHIVAFAYFSDRQAQKYAARAAEADLVADAAAAADWAAEAADWAADAADWASARAADWVADAAEAADWAATTADWAADAAAEAAEESDNSTRAIARKEQLEFLEWTWATTKQHTKRKISLKNGLAIVL
jgi:hypothetical protein